MEKQTSVSTRRSLVTRAAAGVVAAGVLATGLRTVGAQEEESTTSGSAGSQIRELLEALSTGGYLWQATSPSTHPGDVYTIDLTNRTAQAINVLISTIIMDHQAHHNEFVVEENIELGPGVSQSFEAANDYGLANHFSTRMVADSGEPAELGVQITIVDATGAETARFNERAFSVRSAADIQAAREARLQESEEDHDHN